MPVNWSILEARTNTAALAVFGEACTLNGAVVQGDYVAPGDTLHLGGVSALAGMPQLIVATASVPASPVGKRAVARGTNYRVAEHHPDGLGLSTLVLELAP